MYNYGVYLLRKEIKMATKGLKMVKKEADPKAETNRTETKKKPKKNQVITKVKPKANLM